MKTPFKSLFVLCLGLSMASCVSQKKHTALQLRYDQSQTDLVKCGDNFQDYKDRLARSLQDAEMQKNANFSIVQQREQ